MKNIRSGSTFFLFTLMFSLHEMKIFMVFTEKELIFFLFYFYTPMRVSDVISNVTKQNKTWTSWRQGTKLRVRLSLANARFASRIESDVYNKKKIQMFVVNMTFISSREVKKCTFHSCLRHSWNVHFFTSLDEIKVIFTPNIWISSIYFIFFGIIEPILVVLKIEYRLSRR